MLQQRQMFCKRQREIALKRSQPQLLGQHVALVTQNALHSTKHVDGWSKIFVDPSLFEQQPQPTEAPANTPSAAAVSPAVAAAAPAEQATSVVSQAAAAMQTQAAAMRRPMTGDSTETDILDYVPTPPRLRQDASEMSISGRPGAQAPMPGEEAPGVGGGWDLSIEEVHVSSMDQEKSRGRKFWKPWKQTVRVSSAPAVPVEDVVETLGDFGDEEAVPGLRGAPVDARISTPWTPQDAAVGGMEEICALPGVMEEDPHEIADRSCRMKRPPKQVAIAMDDIEDIDVL